MPAPGTGLRSDILQNRQRSSIDIRADAVAGEFRARCRWPPALPIWPISTESCSFRRLTPRGAMSVDAGASNVFGLSWPTALCSPNVLDLRWSRSERECPERAVGWRCVRSRKRFVIAGLGVARFRGPIDVNDAFAGTSWMSNNWTPNSLQFSRSVSICFAADRVGDR